MVSGLAFQVVLDVVKSWWLAGFQINGQYALTDDCVRDVLPYCGGAYAFKTERQERGSVHCHVLLWLVPTSGRYIELPPVISLRWLTEAPREIESGAEGVGR